MIHLLLNTIALEPNRWTKEKTAYFRLDQLFPKLAKTGFNQLELWQYHISEKNKIGIKNLQIKAQNFGLYFPVIGIYPKLIYTKKKRTKELDKVKKLIEYAKILNSEVLKIFVGDISSNQRSSERYYPSVDFMKERARLANTAALAVTGEIHIKTVFDNIKSCRKFVKDVNAANFKYCFQPYDFKDTGKMIKNYQSLSKDVIHIHFQGKKEGKSELLEQADLDYYQFISKVVQCKFNGYFSIEFVKDCVVKNPKLFDLNLVLENAKKDREFIKNVLNDLGVI